jgi:hypothetical protein
MGRYASFSLYWESWGGYPERSYPFGGPTLVRVLASADFASVTLVGERSEGPQRLVTKARAERLPAELVTPLPGLLAAAGAFGDPVPLVDDPGDGDYLVVDDLTGFSDGRPFHLSLQHTTSAALVWRPAARRLMDALQSIRGAAGELT